MSENPHWPSKQMLQKSSLPLKEIQNGVGKKDPHLSQVPTTASSCNRPREIVLMQRPGMELLPAEGPKAQFGGGGHRVKQTSEEIRTEVVLHLLTPATAEATLTGVVTKLVLKKAMMFPSPNKHSVCFTQSSQ